MSDKNMFSSLHGPVYAFNPSSSMINFNSSCLLFSLFPRLYAIIVFVFDVIKAERSLWMKRERIVS
jgi:hypothetical protein